MRKRAVDFSWQFSDLYGCVLRIYSAMLSMLSATTLSIFLAKRRLINVISFLIFVFGGNIFYVSKGADYAKTCTEYTDTRFNISIMDCTRLKPLKGLPNNLSANIQGLNVSGVRVLPFRTNNTYAKFKDSLLLLDTSNTFSYTVTATGIYVILSKLIYLDISYDCLFHENMVDERLQVFPTGLKVLKINGCRAKFLDVSYLLSLEELHLSTTEIKRLPRINAKAPLRFLDLTNNNLSEFSPMDLAEFCTLREVVLDFEPERGLNQPKYYCLCISLKNWFTKTIIKTAMTCTQPYSTPDCHKADLVEANASAIYTRRCKSLASRIRSSIWWLSLPLTVSLLLTVIVCITVMIRRRRNKGQSESAMEEQEEEEKETFEESTDTMIRIGAKAIAESS